MIDFNCPQCEDTGRVTVRVSYPMAYVGPGEPPEHARGVTGARGPNCDAISRWRVEDMDDE